MIKYRWVFHLLFFLWPTTAVAALNLIESFKDYDWAVLGILFFVATLAGLTSLGFKLNQQISATGKPPPHTLLYVSSHMLASWCGAMMAVFVGEIAGAEGPQFLLLVLAFSFGGVGALERGLNSVLEKFLPPPPNKEAS